MIKIQKSNAELGTRASWHYQIMTKKKFKVDEQLDLKLGSLTAGTNEYKFYDKCRENLPDLIKGKPHILEDLISKINPLYKKVIGERMATVKKNKAKVAKATAFKNEVLEIFNYDKFTGAQKGYKGFYAYMLAKWYDVNVCPFCNRMYTFTVITPTGKTRPTFDHFYDKGTYPYLAVSFYNLVPSCQICNSSLKGSKEFRVSTNLHPLIEGGEIAIVFRTGIKSIDFVEGRKKSFKITMKPNNRPDTDLEYVKANNNALAFKLRELYNMHKTEAGEILKKCHRHDEREIDNYETWETENGHRLVNSREEAFRMIWGNYVDIEDLGKRPLAKFTRDILDEQEVLKFR